MRRSGDGGTKEEGRGGVGQARRHGGGGGVEEEKEGTVVAAVRRVATNRAMARDEGRRRGPVARVGRGEARRS